jgi:hypothetical protein
MKTGKMRSLQKLASGPCVAFLALSMAFGASAVRADSETSTPTLQEMLLSPIMDAVHAVGARLASLETAVASLAGSFTSRQITSQELCIADQTGAQTCVTKAQLDALLTGMARMAAVEPVKAEVEAIVAPAVIVVPEISEPAADEHASAEAAVVVVEAEVAAQSNEAVIAEPATVEPAVLEATGQAEAPAAPPADAAALDIAPVVDEPATTGSLSFATTGFALIWYPDVEMSVAGPATSAE